MMRIVIAGGGGLAFLLARQLSQTVHPVFVLSRQERPEYDEFGVQVGVVDYSNAEQLGYFVRGADLVISTISGPEQLALIRAAWAARVRRFVPAEFEGPLELRPTGDDPLDRGSRAALELLRGYARPNPRHRMLYTVFSCGVFYERLYPGGGLQVFGIGGGAGLQGSGSYLVDLETMTAEIPAAGPHGRQVRVSMTSVHDVVAFVVAAVELGPNRWREEMRMQGDQMTVREVVSTCSQARRATIAVTTPSYQELQLSLDNCRRAGDLYGWQYYRQLVATAEGRYHISRPNLNDMVAQSADVDVTPTSFRDWLSQTWS